MYFLNSRGVTLVEVILVIFLIAIFSSILIANFPAIKLQFALSRTAYKFSQDTRRAMDMALSAKQSYNAKGYGIYVDLENFGNKKYIIYADRGDIPDQQFDQNYTSCSQQKDLQKDCIVETIDFSSEEPGIIIKKIDNTSGQKVSINFSPPNPDTTITQISGNTDTINIIFTIESDLAKTRTVSINTSGMIETK